MKSNFIEHVCPGKSGLPADMTDVSKQGLINEILKITSHSFKRISGRKLTMF